MKFTWFIRNTISKNLYFFILFVCYLFIGCLVLLFVRKGDEVLWFNQFHHYFADLFFKYVTHLGDGLFCIFLSIIFLLWKKYRHALLIFASFAVSGLLSQFFKKVLFPHQPRPTAYLSKDIEWNMVEGVEVLSSNSFPSGHTATAFATFLMLAFFAQHRIWGVLFFLLALIVGLSRIYLLQHFLIDTYAGAILGVISSLLVYYLLGQKNTLNLR
jgi:membrane-associated phospholipid phosphatase